MKRILVVATGGTIASADAGDGLTPALTGEELVSQVPGVERLCAVEVEQVLNIDSSNMGPDGWLKIAAAIERSYDAFDSFVVLHGTDTLAYTAAALSYLVQGSRKPIVLTGSQLPMEHPDTDARRNVLDALAVACDRAARDVLVVFAGRIIAGTRARKQRTKSFDAFASVNAPQLGHMEAGEPVWELPCPDACPVSLRFYSALETRVCALKLTPGLDAQAIRAFGEGCAALVVEAFGIGGVPEYAGVARELLSLADAGVLLVMTTQVPEEACDMGVYEVGRAFAQHRNVVQGADMSTEALVAKAMWALAVPDTDAAQLICRPVNHDRN